MPQVRVDLLRSITDLYKYNICSLLYSSILWGFSHPTIYTHIDCHRWHILSALAVYYCIMKYLLVSILGLFIIDSDAVVWSWTLVNLTEVWFKVQKLFEPDLKSGSAMEYYLNHYQIRQRFGPKLLNWTGSRFKVWKFVWTGLTSSWFQPRTGPNQTMATLIINHKSHYLWWSMWILLKYMVWHENSHNILEYKSEQILDFYRSVIDPNKSTFHWHTRQLRI